MKMMQRFWVVAVTIAVIIMLLPIDMIAQRNNGGGSFGGRRSYSAPSRPSRAPSGGGSFGGRRSAAPRAPSAAPSRPYAPPPRSGTSPTPRTSVAPSMQKNTFGGSRMNTSSDYTSRYGVPRQTSRQTVQTQTGSQNYVVHRYGGMGDGFMMGYVMGRSPWYYGMPFHPAFYYSPPYTATAEDGSVSVYPGTFQWGTVLFTVLLVGGGLYIVYVWYGHRRRRMMGVDDMSDSSFA